MNLSPHFTLEELSASPTAEKLGLDNTPPLAIRDNLTKLAWALESVRACLGSYPIKIHSGYRCPELNKAVGGVPTSYHQIGLAADFDPPEGMSHDDAQHQIASTGFAFDLIMEEGTAKPESEGGSRWLHFQIAKPGEPSRRMVRDALVDKLGGKIVRTSVG